MKKKTKQLRRLLQVLLGAACVLSLSFTSCKKQGSGPDVNYGDAPRKEVPDEYVGTWASSHVSGSIITYPGGRTEPTWASGIVFTIKKGGTGVCVVSYETHAETSESYSRVDEDCTFEVTPLGNDQLQFNFYVVKGKVYENNVYLHDLEAAKCYPAKSFRYTCELGENEYGRYFKSGDDTFFKKN